MALPDTRILVVDDTRSIRFIVKKVLSEMAFTCITEAEDGLAAWEKLKLGAAEGRPFELIISDWHMPKWNGLDLLMKVRSTPPHDKIPFILLTSDSEKKQMSQAMSQGVTDYIIKPFFADALRERLEILYQVKLPKPKTIWSIDDRAKWLKAAAMAFNLVYRTAEVKREPELTPSALKTVG